MQVPTRRANKIPKEREDATMTGAKYLELRKNLEKLEKKVRPALAEEVKRLAADGDFSENAAYQIAKGRLRGINQRILDINNLLQNADIIEPSANTNFIQVGHFVTVEINSKQKTYQILGATETDPEKGIISKDSPLGQALLHKKIGDLAEIERNDKKIIYKIIKIK